MASKRYRTMVKRWQKVPKIPKPKYREGLRDLTIYGINAGKRVRVFPFFPDGTIDPEAVDELKVAFQDKHSGNQHDLHPRLITLIYLLADHFKARQVTLISGYRDAKDEGKSSNHQKGRAADIMIPGVPLGALARKARTFGHVGVGIYPASGFIHLDVRDGPSYFWIDRSGPGQRSCLKRMQANVAAKADRRWRPKKDVPKRHKNRKGELLGAIPKEPDEPEKPEEPKTPETNEHGSHE